MGDKNILKKRGGDALSMEKRKGGLSGFLNYFLRSYKVTFLILLMLAILGIWTAVTLPRESTPEVKIPIAMVSTVYPGASTRDVEELVTKPIEDELIGLEGLDKLTSSSRLGVSLVVVKFSADENLDDAIRRLREEVDGVRGLPDEAKLPEVTEMSFEDEPIISVGLGGIDDKQLLSFYGEKLAKEIKEVPGVLQVDVAGKTDEEIKIKVNPEKLADLGVSITQIVGGLRAANVNAPFGQLDTDKSNYDLRLLGGFLGVGDVADVPLALPDGTVVTLGTVADVELALKEQVTESRMSIGRENSTPAVTLLVRKKTGGNIVRIVDGVKEKIEQAKQDLPSDLQVVTFADRADDIRTQLNNVYKSGVQTLIIVFGLLWLFLGWRPAIIASLAVPLTFSITFLVFEWANVTLNGVSLFSLILSLGLLVDTAIVIVEGICGSAEEEIGEKTKATEVLAEDNKKTREKKLQARAMLVVDQFTKPLIGGTMTTVAAFFPMLLMTGIIGQFLRVIPIVVAAALMSSLLVALAFIPPVAVEVLARMKQGDNNERWFEKVFRKLRVKYESIISRILRAQKIQWLFIALLTVLLVAGLSLLFTGLLRTGLFPSVDTDFILVNIELDPGTKLEETAKVVNKVERRLKEIEEVTSYVANIGAGISLDVGGGSSSEEMASFFINLDKERKRSSLQIGDVLRSNLADITGAKITIEEMSAGPPAASPIEMRVVGESMQELDRLSKEAMDKLESIGGAIDVDRDLRNSAGEFNFVFDRAALAKEGLSVGEIAQTLRTSVFGSQVTTFIDQQNEEKSVAIEAFDKTVDSIDDILAMPILTRTGRRITLGQVARVDLGSSVDAIRHRDGVRTVTVTADAATGFTPNEITQQLMARMGEVNLPDGYSLEYGGEKQETTETFSQLYRSMVIAVILIMLIMVIEFNSYKQPIIIFLSIPLALIGVLFGLLLFNGQLNFAAFIGLVSLTGIVVNNAIILVDKMNRMRERGASIEEAVKGAANSRLRPIILTTLTTVGGVAPLIWVDEFFRDMAVTLITGLLFSSVITLILIPVLYYRQQTKIERKKEKDGQIDDYKQKDETTLSPVL